MFIVRVFEDSETYEYEYGCIEHAREHFNSEKGMAMLTEYKNGNEYLIECKGEQ